MDQLEQLFLDKKFSEMEALADRLVSEGQTADRAALLTRRGQAKYMQVRTTKIENILNHERLQNLASASLAL